MFALLRNGVVISIGSNQEVMSGCESVVVNANVEVGDNLEGFTPIDKTLDDFAKEADIANEKLRVAHETLVEENNKIQADYEAAVKANDLLDEKDREKIAIGDLNEIVDPEYISYINNYTDYIGGFDSSDFILSKTDEKIQKNKDDKITEINNQFDKTVSEYLSKYPKREQDTFAQKLSEAEKVIGGVSSIYITMKAQALGLTEKQFANIIIDKNESWVRLYTELENEKDLAILALSQ